MTLRIFKQIFETATNKTVVVHLLTSHLTCHSSKTYKTYCASLKEKGRTHKQGYYVDSSQGDSPLLADL